MGDGDADSFTFTVTFTKPGGGGRRTVPRAREVEGERREEHFGLGIGDWGLRMELLKNAGLEFEFMGEVERSGMRGSRRRKPVGRLRLRKLGSGWLVTGPDWVGAGDG